MNVDSNDAHSSHLINAHWGLSLCYLLMGQFDQGWQEFEWRLKDQEFTHKTFPHEYEFKCVTRNLPGL